MDMSASRLPPEVVRNHGQEVHTYSNDEGGTNSEVPPLITAASSGTARAVAIAQLAYATDVVAGERTGADVASQVTHVPVLSLPLPASSVSAAEQGSSIFVADLVSDPGILFLLMIVTMGLTLL